MGHIENQKAAQDAQMNANVVDTTQKTTEDAKTLATEKSTASILYSLGDLMNNLLEEKQIEEDKEKLSKGANQNKGLGGAADKGANSKGANSGADQKDQTSNNQAPTKDAPSDTPKTPMDPLLALVMAGIDNQTQTNLIITALGKAGEEISSATTNASNVGNDWQNTFYSHGETGGAPGSYDTGTHAGEYHIFYYNGSYYWSDQVAVNHDYGPVFQDATANHKGLPTWNGLGDSSKFAKGLASAEKYAKAHQFNPTFPSTADVAQAPTVEWNNAGIPGSTGAGYSAILNQLMQIWSYVQQQVSQINNQFQTVASLPSTMMQTLTQAVNTANAGQSSTVQAMGTTTNLVNGWAGS
jgi:hypothetical protein